VTAPRDFRLPDLGEGLTEGEILRWLVAPGETVELNQPLVEVETAKAAVELPSPYAGVVITLHAAEGQTVDVGTPIVTVDTDGRDTPDTPAADDTVADDTAAEFVPAAFAGERTDVLVGYGPRAASPARRRRAAPVPAAAIPPTVPSRPSAAGVAARVVPTAVLAKPPVRRYARDLGVDLAAIAGTGPGGSVTRADVDTHLEPPPPAAPAGERRIPVRGVRRLMAQNMVASAFTAPHVTEFLTVDVTAGMEAVAALGAAPEFAGAKVTPLTLVARALILAVRRHPEINARWDDAAGEIVVMNSVNLGIAVAAPRGLIVPNVPAAQDLDLAALAHAITALTEAARAGRTAPSALVGGTITITNVGVFGVDTGTPILNPGEAAILALGSIAARPWVHEGELAVRQVTTLALSFDHRMVDGALGSAVLTDVAAAFADPLRMLAWS
jgi:pyruvate dehydrogenase E2 component (dihydrolipoamide acetyltransferase)